MLLLPINPNMKFSTPSEEKKNNKHFLDEKCQVSKRAFHFDFRVKFSLFFTHIFSGVFCHEKGTQSLWVKEKIITMSNFVLRKTFAPDFLLSLLSSKNPQQEAKRKLYVVKRKSVKKNQLGKTRKMLLNIIEKTCCINDSLHCFHIAAIL